MGKVAGEQELALQQHFPYANGEVNAALYAGDSKIFGAVKCIHDFEVVQSTLSNMDEWTRYNNIQFSTS